MLNEDNFTVDILDEIAYSNPATTAKRTSVPSSKCTGRGKKPAKHPSIMQLNLPGVVVKSLKEETRGRGRGRNMLEPSVIHHRPALDTQVFGLGQGKRNATSSDRPGESVTNATQPLNKVLATANERFKSYDVPKRNPARKNMQKLDINNAEQFPSLPTMEFKEFSTSAKTSCEASVADTEQDTTSPPPQSPIKLDDSSCSVTNQSESTIHPISEEAISSTAVAHALDGLFSPNNPNNQSCNGNMDISLSLMQSTPSKESTNVIGTSEATVQSPVLENRDGFYVVRIENLPAGTTQQQLEEVITPYGEVLDVVLELRISGGEEMLSANVKLADGSIAEFLASCLDGAETIFEGSHGPVKCYIK